MNKQSDACKALVFPALCLLLVCLVTSGLLAFTNSFTEPVIAANLAAEAEAKYRVLLPEAEHFDPLQVTDAGKTYTVQVAKKGSETVGYIFNTEKNGYGGPVVCLTGIGADGKIVGVQILTMSETAGLGDNARKPEFLNQYTGRSATLQVVKTDPKGDTDIAAVSGATITSKAVTESVNRALALYKLAASAGKGGN